MSSTGTNGLIEQMLAAAAAVVCWLLPPLVVRASSRSIDGQEDFEEHVLCNVVARILCRAIRAGRINSTVPLTMHDVVVDISQEECFAHATRRRSCSPPPPGIATFHYKFIAVKRELVKLDYIPDWLWREIRDSIMPSLKMMMPRWNRRTNGSR